MFFNDRDRKQDQGHSKYQDKNAIIQKMKLEQDKRKLERQQ